MSVLKFYKASGNLLKFVSNALGLYVSVCLFVCSCLFVCLYVSVCLFAYDYKTAKKYHSRLKSMGCMNFFLSLRLYKGEQRVLSLYIGCIKSPVTLKILLLNMEIK